MRHWVLTPFWVIFDEFWRTHLKKGPKTPFRPPEWLQRRHNRGMASLFLRFPDPTGASLGPKIPKLGSPIISELKPVGFFCLLTKLFTYVSTTFVFYKKKLLCKIEQINQPSKAFEGAGNLECEKGVPPISGEGGSCLFGERKLLVKNSPSPNFLLLTLQL